MNNGVLYALQNPLSYKGNKTNMMVNLWNHHKTEFEEMTKKIEVQQKENVATSSGETPQPSQHTI